MQLIVWSVNSGSPRLSCVATLNDSEKPFSDMPYLLIANKNPDRKKTRTTAEPFWPGNVVNALFTAAGIRESQPTCAGSGPSGNKNRSYKIS